MPVTSSACPKLAVVQHRDHLRTMRKSCCPGDVGLPTQDGTSSQPADAWPDEPPAAAGRWVQAIEVPAAGQRGAEEKLDGFCSVIEEALAVAGKDLDRLILVRELMSRVPARTRSNSKLPELVDLFLSRPLVTVPLAAKLLKVTPKAVDLMLAQLGGALPANSPAAPATEHGASCKA